MADHTATVTVNAPVHQVYELFTHFSDFPKFMSFVTEVSYIDERTSHWVADIAGKQQWTAVNENWSDDRQIGWRSVDGLENSGLVTFQSTNQNQTEVTVAINYNPPAGVLGDAADSLGIGQHFVNRLQEDLNHFAKMVDEAPIGALDPNASTYLFHENSAMYQGKSNPDQNAAETHETAGAGIR